ncbi:MAG TPA: hypothetical protein VJN42_00870 [Candidatus Acidoferrum sp.]|nr:hypothetical protein [Candidatus Acidoferrum sp.]
MQARITEAILATAFLSMSFPAAALCRAQETPGSAAQQSPQKPITSEDRISAAGNPAAASDAQTLKPVDGRRHGLPLETFGVVPGTRFLVSLEDDLNSKGIPERAKFRVKTLEPLEAGSGFYLPSGAEIEGHVSHVEAAGAAGRAKIWLTFDELRTSFGPLPIVAEVVSVPGDHSVRIAPKQEGLIEGRASAQEDAAQAAVAAAALGAVPGVKDKDRKEALEGAAIGAITAYLVETGRGHELALPRGVKLELELERALYLIKE